MNIYIRSAEAISPQRTFGSGMATGASGSVLPSGPSGSDAFRPPFLAEPVEYTGNRLKCVEPDYKDFLDAKLIRRMSRIIKMGVATANACLREAGTKDPDAIITGTAYGCLEDTGLFLTSLIERKEEMLQPGAFIQSTHNTVGAQIALALQCTCYNNTFVHRGLSFESALLDAVMLLREGEAARVLVGGVDEITDHSHAILSRFGLYRRSPISNLALFPAASKGTIAGEGAAFFLLASEPSGNDYSRLEGVATFYKPDGAGETERHIRSFLTIQGIDPATIDLVITGANGDQPGDNIYHQLESSVFSGKPVIPYKHLCGEYPTSASFALWMAANIIKTGVLPAVLTNEGTVNEKFAGGTIKRILIYNHYLTIHHSLILLSA